MDGVQVLGREGGSPLAVGQREVVRDVEGPVAEQASGLVLEELGRLLARVNLEVVGSNLVKSFFIQLQKR